MPTTTITTLRYGKLHYTTLHYITLQQKQQQQLLLYGGLVLGRVLNLTPNP